VRTAARRRPAKPRASPGAGSRLRALTRRLACSLRLIRTPTEYLGPFEEALEDVVRNQDPKYLLEGQEVRVGVTGSMGFHRVTPRQLLSNFLGTLVQVDGIVTKCARLERACCVFVR
jgi:DNA replicative helicase MCM subunit Mcm2 (Cdc46/Mcm family)